MASLTNFEVGGWEATVMQCPFKAFTFYSIGVYRLDYQLLNGKEARAPPPKFFLGRNVDQTQEGGGNRV